MEEVGVLAVVKELQKFLGDMNKVNSAVNGLRPAGSLLQSMFAAVGEAAANFGREVLNVAEITLGVMLRDAIEGILSLIGDLIRQILEAGTAFQTLKIRLTGLNLNDVTNSEKSYADALREANQLSADQLTWLQAFGAATPFDPAQIADTYAQARAFGFADEEAKRLTEDIINYTAGMGLSNDTLFLVIQNLGQMVQRGKITGTEIRDLARGSFLPLADVLDRIAKNMGKTREEIAKEMVTPKGIPAAEFVKAFEQMVEEEPRFVGAAGRLSRALIPASLNVKELITSIFGLSVFTPVFDVLGAKVASFTDQFVKFNEQGDIVKTEKWTALVTAAENLGKALSGVVEKILGLAPSAESLADGLIGAVQGVADWVSTHQDEIVAFFQGVGTSIGGVVAWVRDQLIPFFQRIGDWFTVNQPLIQGFLATLGSIVATVFGNLVGGKFESGDILGGILEAIQGFMAYVILNKEEIAKWAEFLIRAFVAVELLITAFNIITAVIGAVIGFVITMILGFQSFIGIVWGVMAVVVFMVTNFWLVVAVITAIVASLYYFIAVIFLVIPAIAGFVNTLVNGFGSLRTYVLSTIDDMINNIRRKDWVGLGTAMIAGMIGGITMTAQLLASAAVNAAMSAYNAAKRALGIRSPSTLFAEIGAATMQGMAQGIDAWAGMASGAMAGAVSKMAMPAIGMQAALAGGGNTVNNQSTRNFNLTVNSGASTEPILQDFNMLQSLAG